MTINTMTPKSALRRPAVAVLHAASWIDCERTVSYTASVKQAPPPRGVPR